MSCAGFHVHGRYQSLDLNVRAFALGQDLIREGNSRLELGRSMATPVPLGEVRGTPTRISDGGVTGRREDEIRLVVESGR